MRPAQKLDPAARTILYTERHDRRTLVNEVDYASVIGHARRGRSRAELGLAHDGPAALLTPDVLFRPEAGGALLPAARLSAQDWAGVVARTGWAIPAEPPPPFVATTAEVDTLRGSVDPDGLLRLGARDREGMRSD